MSRTLKFRIPIFSAGKFDHFVYETIDVVIGTRAYGLGNCSFMGDFTIGGHPTQFTGMFDSKGKEVYEDDIVAREGWIPTQIWFDNGTYLIGTKGGSDWYFNEITARECTVIGNLIENAELLIDTRQL